MNIREAHSVARIAHELIQTVDEHNHLRDATILHLFTDQEPGPRARGCKRYGRVKSAGEWDVFLFHWGTEDPGGLAESRGLEFRYALQIFETPWSKLSPARQRFVVDELLSHCEVVENEVSGDVSYIVAQHGYQGFAGVLERHGGTAAALDEEDAQIVRVAHQLELPPEQEAREQADLDLAERDEDLEDFPPRSENGQTEEQLAARAEAEYQREARATSDRLAAESAVPA